MKVEIWADVVCPWCGLGTHRFRQALERFEHRDQVEVVYRAFQLDPSAEPGSVFDTEEMLAAKGYSADQVAAIAQRIEDMAAAEGLSPYNVSSAKNGSTALVHELLAFAGDLGQSSEAWLAAYERHWGDNEDIFTMDGVLELAEKIGLDVDEAEAVLMDHRYRALVRDDQAEAQQLGSSGVPFFVIDRRYGIAGAQSADAFLEVLERAWADRGTEAST